jgi:hypothetical protein
LRSLHQDCLFSTGQEQSLISRKVFLISGAAAVNSFNEYLFGFLQMSGFKQYKTIACHNFNRSLSVFNGFFEKLHGVIDVSLAVLNFTHDKTDTAAVYCNNKQQVEKNTQYAKPCIPPKQKYYQNNGNNRKHHHSKQFLQNISPVFHS